MDSKETKCKCKCHKYFENSEKFDVVACVDCLENHKDSDYYEKIKNY